MAFNAGAIKASLTLDTGKFQQGLGKANSAAGRLGAGLRRIGKAAVFTGLVAGAAALGAALAGATKFVKGGITALSLYRDSVASLGAALKAQGVKNIDEVTDSMERFASEFQNATGVADAAIISVSQQLTTFGAAGKVNLTEATEVVIDFAKAMNIDIQTAARSFGQAIAGNAATLGRYLPSVRELTAEQLKTGAAFGLAKEAVGGFARSMGEAGTGPLTRMKAAIEDLQKAIAGPFLDILQPVFERVQMLANVIIAQLGVEGSAAFAGVESAAQGFGNVLNSMVDFAIVGVGKVIDGWNLVQRLFERLNAIIATLGGGFAKIMGLFSDKAKEAAGHFESMRQEANANRKELLAAAGNGAKLTAELKAGMVAARAAAEASGDVAKKTEDVAIQSEKAAVAAKKVGDEYSVVADQVAKAAEFAGDFAEATMAASTVGGGGGGAGASRTGARGGNITAVSTSRINLDDPFAAAAAARAAQEGNRNVGLTAGFANFQTGMASKFARDVTQAATASFNAALADFTSQVLSELNRKGVLDPTERSRIVQQRIDEAERLGILPSRNALSAFGRGVG